MVIFMKKYIKTVIFITLLLAICCPSLIAFSDNAEDYKAYANIYDEAEYQEMESEISGDSAVRNGAVYRYKLYSLSASEFDALSGDISDIAQIVLHDYTWIFSDARNNVTKVKKTNGEWKVIGTGIPSEEPAYPDTIQLDVLKTENMGEQTVCLEVPEYHTAFLYDPDSGVIIPYADRPDLTGLENGKPYSLADMQAIMIFRSSLQNNDRSDEITETVSPDVETRTIPLFYFSSWMLLPMIAIIAVIVIFIRIKKAKKQTGNESAV